MRSLLNDWCTLSRQATAVPITQRDIPATTDDGQIPEVSRSVTWVAEPSTTKRAFTKASHVAVRDDDRTIKDKIRAAAEASRTHTPAQAPCSPVACLMNLRS